jgi:methylenetetrahydrofolate dehydrogenase (NADP+)/methenyltetrahydrofolate cyclohydrolase
MTAPSLNQPIIIDGKLIAEEILARVGRVLASYGTPACLAIVMVGDDPRVASFVRQKERAAEKVGVTIVRREFPVSVSEDELCADIATLVNDPSVDGIVIQLPLPPTMNLSRVLDMIPMAKDVDVLASESIAAFGRGEAPVIPPVAGAIQEILDRGKVSVISKDALVLGHGRLVGIPAALFLRHNHARVTVIDKPVRDLGVLTRDAEIIVSGVGQPGLLTPDMVKEGAVIIDAGTSESEGKLAGDVDPLCQEKAALYTPVPGGVGPITVAMLLKNLAVLKQWKELRSDSLQ